MIKNSAQNKGFTLIEILLTIGILAVVFSIAVLNFPGVQAGARDTRKKSDLKQYQTSLESYANRNNGFYPSYNANRVIDANLCTALTITGTCVQDTFFAYRYFSNGTGMVGGVPSASATNYTLYGTLEKRYGGQSYYWVVCSNGQSGRILTTWVPSSTCPNGLIQ